ncbi:MAG: asparagine synthase (glutamine-hydrolyzing) [Verrucomicrobia bacterium]|nr:asparagine synthase (glutamine-hydrolyzing) [Verrucomicrobiota bacterium]MBI3869525.1 asparagine synthase (glutamine-hydrolyzing) [Verrucomicrobiota bacterium]
MCGIAGIVNLASDGIDKDLLHRMTLSLRHRGPDGDGIYIDRAVGLGHRRLSIIDVAGGAQPIGNEDNTIQVVFNGEIYNYLELHDDLCKRGHRFRTKSDTEVIVHAYEEWGEECLLKFNGMFAFALWDQRQQILLIARDHLGIKPLYYTAVGNNLLFASEIKALLQCPKVKRSVDIQALDQLFTFRFVPSPRTLFEGIVKLPPASVLRVEKGKYSIRRFWRVPPKEHLRISEGEAVERYQDLLKDAVRLQLRSDVPLGLFLSSGIDSGVILAIMREHLTQPVETFTIGFSGGESTNEVDDAKVVADLFDARHTHMMVSPEDYLSYYERYMWDLEEPVGNETAAAFYFVSLLASKKVKVALTGQGVDEPWAGYDRYRGVRMSQTYSQLPRFLTKSLAWMVDKVPTPNERINRAVHSLGEKDRLLRFAMIYSFFSSDMKTHLFQPDIQRQVDLKNYGAKAALAYLYDDVKHLDAVSQMLYIDTRGNLPDDLLMVNDKTSMANSIESRVPLLDVRLVEFIESLPPELKLKGRTAKYLHKKAVERWLPREMVYRPKKGFDNPIDTWFRTRMSGYVRDMLLSKDSRVGRFFDQSYIAKLIEQDASGRQQLRRHLYLLISFEMWHRRFMEN